MVQWHSDNDFTTFLLECPVNDTDEAILNKIILQLYLRGLDRRN